MHAAPARVGRARGAGRASTGAILVAARADACRRRIDALRGWEIMLDEPGVDLRAPQLRLGGGPAVLVEFPRGEMPPAAARAGRVRISGVVPVLAHPERYAGCTPERVREWREAGAVHPGRRDDAAAARARARSSRARCSPRGSSTCSRATTTATRARSRRRATAPGARRGRAGRAAHAHATPSGCCADEPRACRARARAIGRGLLRAAARAAARPAERTPAHAHTLHPHDDDARSSAR